MAARPGRATWTKALRLVCSDADGVRGRKKELDHFLGQHGIDICLLAETHIRSSEAFRMAKCHRTNRLTEGGGAAILVRRGVDNHAVPVQGLSTWRLLPPRSCWPVNRWKSWRFTCHPPGPWLILTWLPALAAVFPSSWRVTWMPSTWTGIPGLSRKLKDPWLCW